MERASGLGILKHSCAGQAMPRFRPFWHSRMVGHLHKAVAFPSTAVFGVVLCLFMHRRM